jgi:hypothetical protein
MAKLYFYEGSQYSDRPMFDLQNAINDIRPLLTMSQQICFDKNSTGQTRAYLEFPTDEEAVLFKLTKL